MGDSLETTNELWPEHMTWPYTLLRDILEEYRDRDLQLEDVDMKLVDEFISKVRRWSIDSRSRNEIQFVLEGMQIRIGRVEA
jgi:hypothetical protein